MNAVSTLVAEAPARRPFGPPARSGSKALARASLCVAGSPEILASALLWRGWDVRLAGSARPPASREDLSPEVLVVELTGSGDEEALALLDAPRREGAELVVLVAAGCEVERRFAASLTPFVYTAPVPVETLATLLERLRERRGQGLSPQAATACERTVAVRLWECVEVDGREVYLGSAERNFLFSLAAREGVRISKLDDVDAGGGRIISAVECRRRLGRRLGAELAELLVPTRRGEPYRFREPAEVEATCRQEPGRPATRVRVVGRSGVRTVSSRHVERYA